MASPADDPCVKAQQHFLFVTGPLHGHINPVQRLAARVLAANPGARVTFSTAVSGHRAPAHIPVPRAAQRGDGGVLHAPYSDGYDDGFDPSAHDARLYRARTRDADRASLAAVVARLRPTVTRVAYTFLVAWALDVARDAGVPAALYWIQPATVFAVYHRVLHGGGHGDALAAACAGGGSVELPGLPALTADALPSIVSAASPEHPMHGAFQSFRDLFVDLDENRPRVLVNTFEALEPEALRAVPELEVVAVGPAVPDEASLSPRTTDDTTEDYMAWLDTKAARSVVYVSFGSFGAAGRGDEARPGCHRPAVPMGATKQDDEKEQEGMVVAWCEQVRVLSHPAVGCFVTHCGWNSALESMACGVPIVALPHWTDQPTVAWLLAERAGVGVRACAVAGDGVVESGELQRCVEAVMGDGQCAADIFSMNLEFRI
ncbi:hypothetical protein EJB05_44821, partial [Eragrostis curvula]